MCETSLSMHTKHVRISWNLYDKHLQGAAPLANTFLIWVVSKCRHSLTHTTAIFLWNQNCIELYPKQILGPSTRPMCLLRVNIWGSLCLCMRQDMSINVYSAVTVPSGGSSCALIFNIVSRHAMDKTKCIQNVFHIFQPTRLYPKNVKTTCL